MLVRPAATTSVWPRRSTASTHRHPSERTTDGRRAIARTRSSRSRLRADAGRRASGSRQGPCQSTNPRRQTATAPAPSGQVAAAQHGVGPGGIDLPCVAAFGSAGSRSSTGTCSAPVLQRSARRPTSRSRPPWPPRSRGCSPPSITASGSMTTSSLPPNVLAADGNGDTPRCPPDRRVRQGWPGLPPSIEVPLLDPSGPRQRTADCSVMVFGGARSCWPTTSRQR